MDYKKLENALYEEIESYRERFDIPKDVLNEALETGDYDSQLFAEAAIAAPEKQLMWSARYNEQGNLEVAVWENK